MKKSNSFKESIKSEKNSPTRTIASSRIFTNISFCVAFFSAITIFIFLLLAIVVEKNRSSVSNFPVVIGSMIAMLLLSMRALFLLGTQAFMSVKVVGDGIQILRRGNVSSFPYARIKQVSMGDWVFIGNGFIIKSDNLSPKMITTSLHGSENVLSAVNQVRPELVSSESLEKFRKNAATHDCLWQDFHGNKAIIYLIYRYVIYPFALFWMASLLLKNALPKSWPSVSFSLLFMVYFIAATLMTIERIRIVKKLESLALSEIEAHGRKYGDSVRAKARILYYCSTVFFAFIVSIAINLLKK